MNEQLLLNMLGNINDNIGELKTHGDDLKTGFEDLTKESIKYHTMVDGLINEFSIRRDESKELNSKLEKIISNGFKIEAIDKRVEGLANIAKHGFVMGVAATFIVGTVAFFAKNNEFLMGIIN